MQVREAPDPEPGEGEVKVRVKAAGVNFADLLARKGLYPDAPKIPCVVGYEIAGVVESLGSGSDEELDGADVIAITRFSGYSDAVVVPQEQVFMMPKRLSYEEAAAIPVNYITAYQLVVVMGGLKSSESILIHNVGGGVGLAALDIALNIGATTFGTSDQRKHEFLRSRGLDHPIDYKNNDWTEMLSHLTDGLGIELVLDPIGGGHWLKSLKALRSTGRLGMYGASMLSTSPTRSLLNVLKFAIQLPAFKPLTLMDSNKGVFGVNLGHLWHEKEKVAMWLTAILEGIKEGWVRPHVDKTFSFRDAADAHHYIEDRKNTGKVILTPE